MPIPTHHRPTSLRAAGGILLLSCYEMGHQPWNLASPLAHLQAAGYQPHGLDTAVEHLSDEAIEKAALIAISAPMHTATRLAIPIAERIRQVNPGAHICFFGLYAWLNSEFLLAEHANSVIGGEFEAPLVALARALEEGKPAHEAPGVRTATHPGSPYLERLTFQPPERASLPPLDQYARFRNEAGMALAGYVEATRGCLHTCLHCPITPVYGGRFFIVPREIVLDDIRGQVQAGARHITFGDPDFLNGPGHVLRILRAMHEEFPEITFDATIKIEHLLEQRELLPELRDLGCAFIVSAIESFSDHVLARLDKGHSAADIEEALAITREVGIPLRASFVAFTPWTTLEDYLHLLHCVERFGLISQIDPVQYSIRLLIPPGSALLNEPDSHEWLGELDARALTYRWQHPDPRMDALYQEVATLVEEDARQGASPVSTFERILDLVLIRAGRERPARERYMIRAPEVVPGLTEAWFC